MAPSAPIPLILAPEGPAVLVAPGLAKRGAEAAPERRPAGICGARHEVRVGGVIQVPAVGIGRGRGEEGKEKEPEDGRERVGTARKAHHQRRGCGAREGRVFAACHGTDRGDGKVPDPGEGRMEARSNSPF